MPDGRTSSAATVIAIILLVAAQNSFTHASRAEEYNTLTLKAMSADDLKTRCDASGGTFEHAGPEWSCQTKKGSVSCNERQCTGITTARSAPRPKELRDPGTVLETMSAE